MENKKKRHETGVHFFKCPFSHTVTLSVHNTLKKNFTLIKSTQLNKLRFFTNIALLFKKKKSHFRPQGFQIAALYTGRVSKRCNRETTQLRKFFQRLRMIWVETENA